MIPRPSEDLRLETEEFLYSNTPDPVQLQQLFCAVTRHFPAFSFFFAFRALLVFSLLKEGTTVQQTKPLTDNAL
jgi:hypothetical protein